jgi:hypothetical protein
MYALTAELQKGIKRVPSVSTNKTEKMLWIRP